MLHKDYMYLITTQITCLMLVVKTMVLGCGFLVTGKAYIWKTVLIKWAFWKGQPQGKLCHSKEPLANTLLCKIKLVESFIFKAGSDMRFCSGLGKFTWFNSSVKKSAIIKRIDADTWVLTQVMHNIVFQSKVQIGPKFHPFYYFPRVDVVDEPGSWHWKNNASSKVRRQHSNKAITKSEENHSEKNAQHIFYILESII